MGVLYVTYCSGKKNPIQAGTPKALYGSRRLQDFIALCELKGYNYAILSAQYGLFFPNDLHETYNVTFKTVNGRCRVIQQGQLLSEEASTIHIEHLIQQIRHSVSFRNIDQIMFYCPPPLLRKKCYLFLLHRSIDHCTIDHRHWRDIVMHISEWSITGVGRMKLVTNLSDL